MIKNYTLSLLFKNKKNIFLNMITYPNAKLNLGLNIHSKLENGYHLLQSYFFPIPLFDILEIVPCQLNEPLSFYSSGIPIPGKSNLCLMAYHLLANDYSLPAVKMHLHKQIPIGAGLGGGSSDASFTLTMLNSIFNLNLSNTKLENYAKELGADCPFFIENTPKLVEGIGDIMTPIPEQSLKNKYLALIFPSIHISTQEAYSGIKLQNKQNYKSFNFDDFTSYKTILKNDFEPHIFEVYPELNKIKMSLYNSGAFYASMSGSGSTMFGLFHKKPTLNIENTLIKIVKL